MGTFGSRPPFGSGPTFGEGADGAIPAVITELDLDIDRTLPLRLPVQRTFQFDATVQREIALSLEASRS